MADLGRFNTDIDNLHSSDTDTADTASLSSSVYTLESDDTVSGMKKLIKKTTTTLGGSEVDIIRRKVRRRKSGRNKKKKKIDPNAWKCLGSGELGISEMREALPDANDRCVFGALQITLGSGKFERTKNLFIDFNGERCGAMKRRAAGEKRAEVHEILGQLHAKASFERKEDCTIANVFEQVGHLFVQDNIQGSASVFSTTTTTVEEVQQQYEREMQRKREEYLQKQRELAQSLPEVILPKIDRIGEIMGLLHEDMGWVNWALFKATSKKLKLFKDDSFGSGTIFALRQALDDNEVLFGLLRLSFGVRPFRRTHFVLLHWVGPQVKRVKRGKLNARANAMANMLVPWNIKIELKGRDDVTVENIIRRVKQIVVVDGYEEDPEEVIEQRMIMEFEQALEEEENANSNKKQELLADQPEEVQREVLIQRTSGNGMISPGGKTVISTTEITETIELVSSLEDNLNWILMEPLEQKKKKRRRA